MNLQTQSPLFSTIPPEIRNRIFWYALQEYDDPMKPYSRETYYTRPGCLGEKRVDTELLRTCKIVYAETKMVPLQDLELRIYLCSKDRAPPGTDITSHDHIARKYSNLTPRQSSQIKHNRFFVQMYKLTPLSFEQIFRKPARATRSSVAKVIKTPETITICVRYTDWWYWESNDALDLETSQWKDIKFPSSVKRVIMELETADVGTRRRQLSTIVRDLFKRPNNCTYGREDGKVLRISEEEGVKEWMWEGPTTFKDGKRFAHHPEGDEMRYVVKSLVWEVVEGSM